MQYDAFLRERDSVMADCLAATLNVPALEGRVARLRELVADLPPEDRSQAAADLTKLEGLLRAARRYRVPDFPLYREASAIFAAANADDGPPRLRAERARDAIRRLNVLAERTDDAEQRFAVLTLTEPLARLASALEAQN